MFQLSLEEMNHWMSQIVISNPALKMSLRKRPYAFTEHGATMAANVLRSERATLVSIEIVRAFTRFRHVLTIHKELVKEVDELKSFALKHSNTTDREFRRVWRAIERLSSPGSDPQRRIGFSLD